MQGKKISLIGAPVEAGTRQRGCLMGPDAYRAAALGQALQSLGHEVEDRGNLALGTRPAPQKHANPAIRDLAEVRAWTQLIAAETRRAADSSDMPIILATASTTEATTSSGIIVLDIESTNPAIQPAR